jgi:hypothetical protein
LALKFRLEKLELGMKLDVRDTKNIWCKGEVIKIVYPESRQNCSKAKFPILKIHYIGKN